MELRNKYLNQANFFTRSVFKLDKEIHKDIVYLIQSKIDFFGTPKDNISISFNDYLEAKSISKNDTYSFSEFHKFADEIKKVGGAFYNNINNSFISFNIVDNVQVDSENSETLKIELGKFGKIFFFKENLVNYIKDITPKGKRLKYIGHTQIENSSFRIKGIRRKKFFEIISQFKNTGFCKISFKELKMYLGYIELVDKSTLKPLKEQDQLKFIFISQDKFEFKDNCPRYSHFERDFLRPAINSINGDISNDINNLKISKKTKTGRKITHLEFRFNALGKDLTDDELKCLEFFIECNLDKEQVIFLIKRIGYQEMYGRWMRNVDRKVYDNDKLAKFYERKSQKEIKNISGYLYQVLFPELKKG
ncbi:MULTISPECIES: replication initiation protein [Tenacibaculum]|uniref:Replication initiation protein n=1 Tax=Tenacibaculum larymnensis TaxID=2878201 RepID=A0A9X4ET11_9FLAO|nr:MULTISPECIES: replication initiation protein [Tenacibaculum]MDE1206032.1 replication initiation protein [Tenacibaculum larymnensis]RLK06710.1 replication initiator protein [Tenacibaculum discolor]